MSLYRFLRSVGFEHDDIAGGLLAEHPAIRLNERRERLESRIQKVCAGLVRHRRAIEKFKERERQNQNPQISERAAIRSQHHKQAYDELLELLAHLKQKHQRLRVQVFAQ